MFFFRTYHPSDSSKQTSAATRTKLFPHQNARGDIVDHLCKSYFDPSSSIQGDEKQGRLGGGSIREARPDARAIFAGIPPLYETQ
jgi:hypothetical protein